MRSLTVKVAENRKSCRKVAEQLVAKPRIEGLPSTAELYKIGAAGAEGTELEGILQNLSGVSHLSPDIVPGRSALDFHAGLGM